MKILLDYLIIIIFFPFIFLILFFVSMLILFIDGAPIFFFQKRVGKDNKIFNIIKFRTMKTQDDNFDYVDVSQDKKRITRLGYFLRSTSLDELPEIINVIKREMSFVGPRPLLPEYLKIYNDIQINRHKVLPGITGLAQINGRNNLEWEKRFEFDLIYVENKSFYLDIKILFITIYNLIVRKDNKQFNETISKKFSKKIMLIVIPTYKPTNKLNNCRRNNQFTLFLL